MPNAERSIPAIVRPASVAAATRRSIISRRTATITTRLRGPSGVETSPSSWKSSTASSIGTGMWSGAEARTICSSTFGSSTTGTSSVRTMMRWLATPRRTVVGRSFSAKSLRSSSVSATGSATSPSRRMPGRSSATAPLATDTPPLTSTWAAARWLGSISSPTMDFSWRRRDLSMI